MFDVFFLSYHVQYADENFEALLDKAPLAKRVDNVQGIFNAHNQAAKLSKTKIQRNWNRKDWWIDADECLELNLVDEVRGVLLEHNVSPKRKKRASKKK